MAKDIKVEIVGDATKLKKSLGEAQGATAKFDSDVSDLGKSMAQVFGAAEVVNFAKDAVQAASHYNETVSKAKVILGEGSDAAIQFAEDAAKSFGLSEQAALDAEATFAIFGKGAGMAGDELVGFSQKMTGLAADMASFSDTSPQEAIEAIGAALRGESEPIRKYGVLLDDATLKNRAMTLGIYKGTGSLTQQQRVLAAQAEILAQTTAAQGDFARTSEGMAGQMKILSAEFENMKIQLGQNLIPLVIDAAKNIIWITDTMGPLIDKANSATEAIGGLSTVLDFGLGGPIGWGKALWSMNDAFSSFTPLVEVATEAVTETDRETRKLTGAMGGLKDSEVDAKTAAADFKEVAAASLQAVQRRVDELQARWDALTGSLDSEKAWINLQAQARDVKTANEDAFYAAQSGAKDAAELIEAARLKTLDLESATVDYGKEIAKLPPEKVTELVAQINNGEIDKVLGTLDSAFLNHTFRVNAHLDSIVVDGETHAAGSSAGLSRIGVAPGTVSGNPHGAEGGLVKARPGGVDVNVAEAGHDELLIPLDGKHNVGGQTIINNITMPVGTNGNDLVRAIKKYESRNGPGWRAPSPGISGGTP